jgi:hypothetical protein
VTVWKVSVSRTRCSVLHAAPQSRDRFRSSTARSQIDRPRLSSAAFHVAQRPGNARSVCTNVRSVSPLNQASMPSTIGGSGREKLSSVTQPGRGVSTRLSTLRNGWSTGSGLCRAVVLFQTTGPNKESAGIGSKVHQDEVASRPLAATSSLAFSGYLSALSSKRAAVPYTAMHPVRQLGNTLFAPSGTNTWLFSALAATEWAVLAA